MFKEQWPLEGFDHKDHENDIQNYLLPEYVPY